MPLDARFYITGGTLPANATSYIDRDADSILLQSLLQGEFCYILTSRQMGKSSLMTRMVKRLREHGVAAAVVDPSGQGFELDARQWYNGLLYQIAASLGIEAETEAFRRSHGHLSPLQLWRQTLREVALNAVGSHITIFIDEIDVVHNLPFSTDEFFAAIRAFYNSRAEEAACNRLNFCLLGVSTPADLIANISLTPFNIGTRVELRGFTRIEACHLENELGRSVSANHALMDRIYYWTSGHPYLTQRLCLAVAENSSFSTRRCVDSCVEQLFLSANAHRQDRNIEFVNQRMLPAGEEVRAGLLTLYSRIHGGAPIEDSETTALVTSLKLAGIVCTLNGRLIVANRIYRRVFDRRWISDKMPGAERRRQQTAYRRGLIRATATASAIVAAMGILTGWAIRAENRANRYRDQADKANSASQQRLKDARRASYTLTMNLIQTEWSQHNVAHVLDMLESTRNSEYRGFEWGYWNHLCHLEQLTLKGHTGYVNAVAFSPNGKYIATGSRDETVIIWDAHSGREILRFTATPIYTAPLKPGVMSLSYSPDGSRLVVGCNDTVAMWDSDSAKCIWMSPPNVRSPNAVAFSEDGKRVAVSVNIPPNTGMRLPGLSELQPARDDPKGLHFSRVIKVLDALTGRDLLTIFGHTNGVKTVAFSPDGTRIASGGYDQTARIWNASTGREMLEIKDPVHAFTSVAFSPDGSRLITGLKRVFEPENRSDAGNASNLSTVKLWDVRTGRETLELKGYTTAVKSAVFSPDGKRFATSGYDATARIWDAATGLEQNVFRGHTDYVVAVAFSPDGKRLVSGSYDHTAKVWDCNALNDSIVLPERAGRVTSVAESKDGQFIATGSGRTAADWDPTTGRENVTYPEFLSRSNSVLACGLVEVRNSESGDVLFRLMGYKGDVTSVAFSQDSSRIVAGSYDGTARVWNTRTGREIATLVGHEGAVTSVAFSPDGARIITGSLDKTAKIWEAATGKQICTLRGHTGPISSVAVSPNGKQITTGSSDRTAKLWDASTGRVILYLSGHSDEVLAVAFSPDGGSIATGSADNTAIVWNSATGTKRYILKGHTDNVNSTGFSPDGRRIITGSDDHTAKIWDADTGQELLTLTGHTRAIHGVCFSPDGRDVITGSWDKTTKVWHAKFD